MSYFLETAQHCPTWMLTWKRVITSLTKNTPCCYRSWTLTSTNNMVTGVLRGERSFTVAINDPLLFLYCHEDLHRVWNVYFKNPKNQLVKKLLLHQWPADPVWKQEIETIEQNFTQFSISSRYLPRLLAERKQALILYKQQNCWVNRNGTEFKNLLNKNSKTKQKTLLLLTQLPLLEKIEIPPYLDWNTLSSIVCDLLKGLKKPLIQDLLKGHKHWSLAFRRIEGMGFKGCFDAASQTVIVDPRHLDTLKHEVCHWILGHDIDTYSVLDKEKEVEQLLQTIFD